MKNFEVAPEEAGERLDRLVAQRLGLSRSTARRMIEESLVQVDGVETHTTIWVHGVRAPTMSPQKDVPATSGAGCA